MLDFDGAAGSGDAKPRPARAIRLSRVAGAGDFRRNPLGSWTPRAKVTIIGPSGPFTVEPDEVFSLDSTVMSVNIAAILDERCL